MTELEVDGYCLVIIFKSPDLVIHSVGLDFRLVTFLFALSTSISAHRGVWRLLMSLNDEWRPSSHASNGVGELPINAQVLSMD